MPLQVTTTQKYTSNEIKGNELLVDSNCIQVFKIEYYGSNAKPAGEKRNWYENTNSAPWALVTGGFLVWLENGWAPDNLDSIALIEGHRLREGEHLILTNQRWSQANPK